MEKLSLGMKVLLVFASIPLLAIFGLVIYYIPKFIYELMFKKGKIK